MGEIDQLVQFEVANSAVAFREQAYGKAHRQEFLRDILGLANAETNGPRYLVLGVRDAVGGSRKIVGISEADAAMTQKSVRSLLRDFVEPVLDSRIDERMIDGERVVTIVLPDCSDPPYLLRRNASTSMRVGSGWIRRGTEFCRMGRGDLQRIFEAKLMSRSASAEVRLGFAGRLLEQVLYLPVMPLELMPSDAASEKIRQLLAAREVVDRHGVADRTRLQRLVHAQLFGLDETFRADSEKTLLDRLDRIGGEHEAADRHYEFEERAHKVNLMIENVGSAAFEQGTLVLDFPVLDGVVVADRLWPPPGAKPPARESYPAVDVGARTVRVQVSLGEVPAGARGMVFEEPLRLCLREPAAGKVVPISFTLYGRSLRAPISGALRIQVEEIAQASVVTAINE